MELSGIADLSTGDVVEKQVFVFIGMIIFACIFVFFAGTALRRRPPGGPTRADDPPKKDWKKF
jgi:hypothetical protein